MNGGSGTVDPDLPGSYTIEFVPCAVTWEQKPKKLSTSLRQRGRWTRGNNYRKEGPIAYFRAWRGWCPIATSAGIVMREKGAKFLSFLKEISMRRVDTGS